MKMECLRIIMWAVGIFCGLELLASFNFLLLTIYSAVLDKLFGFKEPDYDMKYKSYKK